MEGYVLKVVSGDDHEKDADPSVAEKVLTDVDRLFTEICRNIIRGELRLQGDVPESLHSRVTLQGKGALAHDARRIMHETLTYLGGPARGTFMDDTFPDVIGRRSVASAVLDIHSDLEGNVLLHGPDDDVAAFSDINLVRVTEMAGVLTRAYNGGIMGIIVKDPKRRGHYAITSGNGLIPLIYVPTVPSYDREDFAAAGPVIAMGTVVRDEENRIVELRAVENCYTFPVAVFLRGISSEGDVGRVPEGDLVRGGRGAGLPAGGHPFVLRPHRHLVPEVRRAGPGVVREELGRVRDRVPQAVRLTVGVLRGRHAGQPQDPRPAGHDEAAGGVTRGPEPRTGRNKSRAYLLIGLQ